MKDAADAEAEIVNGYWKGPLHGIPLAIKDMIETAGIRTTAGSGVLKDFVPQQDAFVVQRLKAAGAVLLGKLNLHEFSYGGSSMISYFGPVRNSWDPDHTTGGSSSGSAAAVAAGLCYASVGTDTAGSIRLPAAHCGVVGLKPTYGLVSTRGVIPLSWTHDHVGPLGRTVSDVAVVLQSIAGYDSRDIYSRPFPFCDYHSEVEQSSASLRLGAPREFFWNGLEAEVEKTVEQALNVLNQITAGIEDVDFPEAIDRTVVRCEPFLYHQKSLKEHPDKYQVDTLRRIRSGADVGVGEYVEKYQDLLRRRREITEIFDHLDLIITPTCPILPPRIAQLESAPHELRQTELIMLRNTRPFNVLGLPSISLPCGFSQSGLPISLQITGSPGAEDKVLCLDRAYEKETEWHLKKPSLSA